MLYQHFIVLRLNNMPDIASAVSYPYFLGEEAEAQRGQLTCIKSHHWQEMELNSNPCSLFPLTP